MGRERPREVLVDILDVGPSKDGTSKYPALRSILQSGGVEPQQLARQIPYDRSAITRISRRDGALSKHQLAYTTTGDDTLLRPTPLATFLDEAGFFDIPEEGVVTHLIPILESEQHSEVEESWIEYVSPEDFGELLQIDAFIEMVDWQEVSDNFDSSVFSVGDLIELAKHGDLHINKPGNSAAQRKYGDLLEEHTEMRRVTQNQLPNFSTYRQQLESQKIEVEVILGKEHIESIRFDPQYSDMRKRMRATPEKANIEVWRHDRPVPLSLTVFTGGEQKTVVLEYKKGFNRSPAIITSSEDGVIEWAEQYYRHYKIHDKTEHLEEILD